MCGSVSENRSFAKVVERPEAVLGVGVTIALPLTTELLRGATLLNYTVFFSVCATVCRVTRRAKMIVAIPAMAAFRP